MAVDIDIYSRTVIGWRMNQRMNKALISNPHTMDLFRCQFPKNVILHSDRGSHIPHFKIKNCSLIDSMSRKGNSWDNAIAESFFHALKIELFHTEKYATREQAK